jgi:tetratricopeptide (TPR) repeat protein/MinD-like ATPase involved in chromosome partitioning or flagellar assembly
MSRIITFYSYKGGVGRTLALANIGVLLAKRKKRVLLMDWDLEAPGLDRYFRPYLSDRVPTDRGTIHLLQEAVASSAADWRAHVQEFTVLAENTSPRASYSLNLISSGVASPEYAQKVRAFSWASFIEDKDGGSTLERWRDEWKKEFDFILIDSRTGITDTGGICTILLPDFLVLVFSANDQSFEGALSVARSVQLERRNLAVPRPPLTILPLLSRFDRTQEVELADQWLMRCARDLKPLYDDWLPSHFDSPLEILELTKVPYVTRFSFGEPLPVLTHSLTEPTFPGFFLENSARLLASDFGEAEEIIGRRAPRNEERSSGFSTPTRVFISYSLDSPEHADHVLALAQQLRQDGIDANLDRFHYNELIDWPRWYEEQLRPEKTDFVLTICSVGYKQRIEDSASADVDHGVLWEGAIISHHLYEAKTMNRFIPILLNDEPEDALLTLFRGLTWFRVRAFGVQSGDEGYMNLYRLLTNQPSVIKALTGKIKPLPPQEPSSHSKSFPATGKPMNLPYPSLGSLFKGREDFISAIAGGFTGDTSRGLPFTARYVIYGLGGVGKTRTAVEYAWRFAENYSALLFVSARSPVDLRANLADLCNPSVFNLPEWNQPEEMHRLAAVFRWFSENPGWLLILDNADKPEAAAEVEKTLPQLQGGQVMITSRIADWSTAVQPIELDVLAEENATAILLEHTESRRKKMLTDSEDAAALARDLGGLALALEQAGTYVAKKRVSFSEYRRRWESHKEDVLAWHDERLMTYPKSVATTWQTAIEELSRSERNLLNILAWLAPEPIPLSLLEGKIVDGVDARDALAGLASLSLARWMSDEEEFTVHRLVQEITRQRLSDNEKQETLEAAVALLDSTLPSPEWDQKGWRLWEQLAPHCRTVLNRLRDHALEPRATPIMNLVAVWLNNRAEHGEAEPLYRRALEIDEKSLGPDHPNVARGLNNLAALLRDTNRLTEAEPLYRRALAITEKSFGPDHPNVAIGLNNLALLLSDTNRLTEAEPLFRRGLAITEKSFDPDHPDVATGLNSLAGLLRDTNRLAEAEPLYRRALEIDQKSFGPDHPNVAKGLNNLASLLRATDRLSEAEPLYHRGLAITEKSFGPDHPNVAIGLNNLALLLSATNRLAQAEPLYRRALAIDEKRFGPDHPRVATGFNNLALLLYNTNRLAEAEPLYRRALAITEKSFGPDHPNVARGLNNLATLLRDTNQLAEAEPLYRRALAIDEKSFGPDHLNVAIDLNNLAGLLSDTNRLVEAEPLYRRALAITERSFSPDHPNVASGLNNLALLLSATNRLVEAEPLYRRALAITEKSFGSDHPNVAIGLNNLAGLLRDTNRLAEAEALYRRALEINEKSLSPDHPNVANGLNNLASLLNATNRLVEAEPLYRRGLAITEESFGPDHPNVAIGLNNLALLLSATNRLVEAETLFRRSLAIDEKSFGPDHPNVARDLNNLALLLCDTNRSAEAEPLFRRGLAITEKSFGPDHPFRAKGLNNLALLLSATNRLAEAEPLFRRALAIDEKSFGPDHPRVATGLNNLAGLLRDTNRLDEAEPLFRRALSIDEKSLGPGHPNVAIDLNNLAWLLKDTNRLAEAEPLFRQALAIDEKSFGPDHPNVARNLNNLALLLKDTNRYAEAETLFHRALSIDEKSFGHEHPDMTRDLNNLAWLLKDTNRLAETEPLFRRALAIREKVLRPEHPEVAASLNNLAWLLKDTGRHAEAETLFRRALSIDEKSFGPEHPMVARDLNNLAWLLKDTNRLAQAERLFEQALAIWEKTLGPVHPNVATCLESYAVLQQKLGRLEEAAKLEARARAIRAKNA